MQVINKGYLPNCTEQPKNECHHDQQTDYIYQRFPHDLNATPQHSKFELESSVEEPSDIHCVADTEVVNLAISNLNVADVADKYGKWVRSRGATLNPLTTSSAGTTTNAPRHK